ncbi:drug/metabolite transporter (DMT)-like permease [Pacificibacter maritimus]|uniref:Drug/metabolite transporter (DMT)-like permease n=1 Tax=Pacificibacter maritimus TaxID=762213 RepID=A0A3N4UMY0_9RHOB|nr:DMT family transporter [Pacificibacter maritimus]RPE71378.1 drug/metabolite transporter (DMT)-like permease [Pacificibacter maritimus]
MTQGQNPLSAALWMLGAVFGFSALAVSGRQVSNGLDTFEIMTYRSAIGVITTVIIAYATRQVKDLEPKALHLHLGRNLFHFAGQNLWLLALTLIPLAQLFALEFIYPILVGLGAAIVFGERITPARAVSFLCGFIGILIVARPFGSAGLSIGLLAALACAVGFAGSALFTKKLTQTAHVTLLSILFYLSMMQLVMGIICAGFDGEIRWPQDQAWPWICAVCFAGLGAHFCLSKALSLAPASVVTPIDFMRLPLIAVIGMFFYNEQIDIYVFIGAFVIFSSNYINILYENRARHRLPR